MSRRDLFIAPALEAALISVMALAGWITHQPLMFASLGPTAYELVETPERHSARPYNIIVGNLVALVGAFLALGLTHASASPPVSSSGVPFLRVWAAIFAAAFTVFGTLLLKATQPAALSTTLLMSLGVMQTWKDGAIIMVAVLLMTLIGEPVRRLRARGRQQ